MKYLIVLATLALTVVMMMACTPEPPPKPDGVEIVTPVPTIDPTDKDSLCNALDEYWGQDWPQTIRILGNLRDLEESCDPNSDTSALLYSAYIGYGTLLENRGRQDDAIEAYENALTYRFNGQEAAQRLRFLQVFTPEPPPLCDSTVIDNVQNLMPEYTTTSGEFIHVDGDHLMLRDEVFRVYGINYYPRDYPGERFLTQANIASLDYELDLLRASGINTLRLYIRHDDLFICQGNGAIAIPANLSRLDEFIHLAATRQMRLILVLNHDPDLVAFPLYESPVFTLRQIEFLVNRYHNEPAVMAYDLRDSGDADYAANSPSGIIFDRDEVLAWLAEVAALVRRDAPKQLITAGWRDDSAATIPLVDFVSFHNYETTDALRQEIANLKAATTRPILLAAVGFSTEQFDELAQRQAFQRAFEAVQANDLAGWVVTTAFDYPLTVLCNTADCEPSAQPELQARYGLWNTSYFPKRAVDALQIATGVSTPVP